MLQQIFDDLDEDTKTHFFGYGLFFTQDELDVVKDMIKGITPKQVANTDAFLYQIVHNTEFQIDVDKMAYLQRDCRSTRLALGVDCDRMKMSFLTDDGKIDWPVRKATI